MTLPTDFLPRHTLVASRFCRLDSDVLLGGGTDETEKLQALLDRAAEWGDLTLVLDGAALVSGLVVHSHTAIFCPNRRCGLFLKDGSHGALLRNARPDFRVIRDEDILLQGGTYNHNSPGQLHHTRREPDPENLAFGEDKWCIGFEFYGVRGLTVRDLTLRNQRTFGMLVANWRDVVMEDVRIDLPDNQHGQNQDGIHFWGPGRFLSMRNIRGGSGDDFIALAPDENDRVSSIEDVLIDGVHLEDADQGIRLLSRGTGRLDRVVIRNVTGTYKSFGFFIDPYYPDSAGGNFGHIVFEGVDLRPTAHKYTFRSPFLFLIGGRIDCLELRRIHVRGFEEERLPIEFGDPFHSRTDDPNASCRIRDAVIEGLTVADSACRVPVRIDCRVDEITLSDLRLLDETPREAAVHIGPHGEVGTMRVFRAQAGAAKALVHNGGSVGTLLATASLVGGEIWNGAEIGRVVRE